MFYLVDRILVLIICPSVIERGDIVKCLVIKIFGIVMKFDDISETNEGPPE